MWEMPAFPNGSFSIQTMEPEGDRAGVSGDAACGSHSEAAFYVKIIFP